MSALRKGPVLIVAVTVASLLMSGCAIGVSAGANVSVTDQSPPREKPHAELVRDPYQSASTIAADAAVSAAHPH